MFYFSYISNWYLPKNNLDKAVLELLREFERAVIHAPTVSDYKSLVLKKITDLERVHNRCRPKEAYWRKPHSGIKGTDNAADEQLCFKNGTVADFRLYKSKP